MPWAEREGNTQVPTTPIPDDVLDFEGLGVQARAAI